MPIAKKVTKPQDSDLLNHLPSTRKMEVAVGNNVYELYSLPRASFMSLSSAIKAISEDIRERLEDKQQEGLDIAKKLADNMVNVVDDDTKRAAIEVMDILAQNKVVDPMEFLFSDELQEHIEEILNVCLEGVDKEDRDEITADQLARISEAIFVLNFLGFIRTIKNASYFFRS